MTRSDHRKRLPHRKVASDRPAPVEASAGRDPAATSSAEDERLRADADRSENWKRWGPYLSERQWGTVREDYSPGGSAWDYFPHDHARSRAYRWGEDGLLGIADRQGRLCFALALWNGRDPILKERLFGLAGTEGNHGEDVKECYYYLDSTPTHSYMKALYKYPQAEYPYARLVGENRSRGLLEGELELLDTGVFDQERYFDVFAEYAKASPNDVLIRVTAVNRGPEPANLHVLPTLWFRNTWSWGRSGEGHGPRPRISVSAGGRCAHGRGDGGDIRLAATHASLGDFVLAVEPGAGPAPELLFTDNETNVARLYGGENATAYVKDAFDEIVIHGRAEAVNPECAGTKAAPWFRLEIPAGGEAVLRLRLYAEEEAPEQPFGDGYDAVFEARMLEADEFYARRTPGSATAVERNVLRQAYAGLLWSKQFYHYVIGEWLDGDPSQPAAGADRRRGRNSDWPHLHSRDVISMPDKWEYPWFAAWDLAFHMIPFAAIDPQFAKEQLVLFLREWYMHPNGQIPAYEWALGDVNPPVHAWACWRVYKMTGPAGGRDRLFLERTFQKLLLNFTWWVNRKDVEGKHLFAGGFLGLDNIGVFDRSRPLPTGGHLEQADGTAWMAFYCATMLSMALELASEDPVYEDLASKFFEHFIAIADAMNHLGGSGLWNEEDGFYYDQLHADGVRTPLRVRSMVGLLPLLACELLEEEVIARLPSFRKRMEWFLENRQDVTRGISCLEAREHPSAGRHAHRLLAIPTRERLSKVLRYLLDESEFLSPYGLRSVSAVHREAPFVLRVGGEEHRVDYAPGDATTGLFGGNSNWRGPIWFPVNYLIVEALERYHHFYGDGFEIECPVGSGRKMNLGEVAREIGGRLARIFLPDASGRRPCHGGERRYGEEPSWRDLVLFYECFHADEGRGLGASHQTGWTALTARLLEDMVRARG
ncbi:MAG TPA: glucosidase [Thermoanaerobaculia bacterium]|nr:glucosidase [Thermoanaerobaculia bacterium]